MSTNFIYVSYMLSFFLLRIACDHTNLHVWYTFLNFLFSKMICKIVSRQVYSQQNLLGKVFSQCFQLCFCYILYYYYQQQHNRNLITTTLNPTQNPHSRQPIHDNKSKYHCDPSFTRHRSPYPRTTRTNKPNRPQILTSQHHQNPQTSLEPTNPITLRPISTHRNPPQNLSEPINPIPPQIHQANRNKPRSHR